MSETYKLPFTAEEIEERLAKAGNALLSGGLPKVTLSTVVNLQEDMTALSEEESAAVELAAENGVFLVEVKVTGMQELSPEATFTCNTIMQKVTMSENGMSLCIITAACYIDGSTLLFTAMNDEGTWVIYASTIPIA